MINQIPFNVLLRCDWLRVLLLSPRDAAPLNRFVPRLCVFTFSFQSHHQPSPEPDIDQSTSLRESEDPMLNYNLSPTPTSASRRLSCTDSVPPLTKCQNWAKKGVGDRCGRREIVLV